MSTIFLNFLFFAISQQTFAFPFSVVQGPALSSLKSFSLTGHDSGDPVPIIAEVEDGASLAITSGAIPIPPHQQIFVLDTDTGLVNLDPATIPASGLDPPVDPATTEQGDLYLYVDNTGRWLVGPSSEIESDANTATFRLEAYVNSGDPSEKAQLMLQPIDLKDAGKTFPTTSVSCGGDRANVAYLFTAESCPEGASELGRLHIIAENVVNIPLTL